MMHQRLRGGDRIEHQSTRVTVGVDAARHCGIARIKLRHLLDARQTGGLGLAPAARAEGALECLHLFNPAVGVKLELPDQRRGLLALRRDGRGLATESGDRCQGIAPGLSRRAKKRRRIRQRSLDESGQGRWCRHDVETHAGLLHQLGEPVAARSDQCFDHARDAMLVPSPGSRAKPGGQQQTVCRIDTIAGVQVLPVHLGQGQRVFIGGFIAQAHTGCIRPAPPGIIGRRFARARFGNAEFSRGAPGLRGGLCQQDHRVNPGQPDRHRAAPRFHCGLVFLVGGGKALGGLAPAALHCRFGRHKHTAHG